MIFLQDISSTPAQPYLSINFYQNGLIINMYRDIVDRLFDQIDVHTQTYAYTHAHAYTFNLTYDKIN